MKKKKMVKKKPLKENVFNRRLYESIPATGERAQ